MSCMDPWVVTRVQWHKFSIADTQFGNGRRLDGLGGAKLTWGIRGSRFRCCLLQLSLLVLSTECSLPELSNACDAPSSSAFLELANGDPVWECAKVSLTPGFWQTDTFKQNGVAAQKKTRHRAPCGDLRFSPGRRPQRFGRASCPSLPGLPICGRLVGGVFLFCCPPFFL